MDPGSCSRIALDCNARKMCLAEPGESRRGEPRSRSQAPRPLETTVFGETVAKVARRTNRSKARPAVRGARQEGSEAGSRPFPRPKTPRTRVRCPEGPSIKGPHRIGQAHVPRETRVTRGPAEALAASSNAASTDSVNAASEIERSAGCSCSWSVADVDKTHLSSGARPAERQAANHGVAFCGGLLGDDEGPIRSGQKGAGLERANRLVSAQKPAFTARCGIESTEGVLVRVASSP